MMNYMTSNTRIPPYMVFPRFLLDLRLNGTARLLYTILLDRARLSQGNAKFTDEKGQVYVIFPIESLAAAINKSEMTVKNALSDLEKQGLIKRKHQKVGQTTHIYVKLPADSHLPISLTKTHLGQKSDTCELAIDYSPDNRDNNQSSSQKDFFPSHGQDPVSLADRKLSGNKNNKIKETQNNKEPDDKDILNAFEVITRELSRIGNNLNQLTQYFHMGGLISASMQELLRDCINDVMDMRKEVMKLGGDYRGYSKTHRK